MMTGGTGLGPGIYAGQNFNTSVGFCKAGNVSNGWTESLIQSQGCMAIVEIIKQDSYLNNPECFVVQNDKDIIIRYFLILSDNKMKNDVNISSLNLEAHYNQVYEKYMAASKDREKTRRERSIKKAKEIQGLD